MTFTVGKIVQEKIHSYCKEFKNAESYIAFELAILFYFWKSILQRFLHNYTDLISSGILYSTSYNAQTSKSNSMDRIWYHEKRDRLKYTKQTIFTQWILGPHFLKWGKSEYINARPQKMNTLLSSWILELGTMADFSFKGHQIGISRKPIFYGNLAIQNRSKYYEIGIL